MDSRIKLFFNLIKHRLRPKLDNVDLPESVDQETVEKLMSLAGMHSLTTIIGSALVEQNLIPEIELYKTIQKNTCRAAIQSDRLHMERQWLAQILEDAQIPYVPLKGSIIREYYPESWLRTSCDIDILIHEADMDRAIRILQKNGCMQQGEKGFHDISLRTPNRMLLELHFNIRENIPVTDRVLDRVWEYCEAVPGKQYEYRQTNAFLMFYLIAHMAYHCVTGGCGIRSVIDIWLLRDKMEYDSQILQQLLQDAKLEKFYGNVLRLVDVWFGDKTHTTVTRQLEQIVITGGTYGSMDNKILIDQAKAGSKAKRLRDRIFMPYRDLKTQYPVLKKHRELTPVFEVFRWFRIFTGDRLHRAIREYDSGQTNSKEKVEETRRFLHSVGLYFSERK